MSLEGLSQDEINGLAAVAAKAARDPKLRKDFMKLVRAVNPERAIPELDAEERIMQVQEESAKQLAAMEAKLQERDARDKWAELRAAPIKQGLIEESELPDLEKWMGEKGIAPTNYVDAARLRAMEKQMAEPVASDAMQYKGSVINQMGDWAKDPVGTSRRTAYEMVNQFRNKTFRA